jgi:glutamate synthase (NADPH/NADH) small chain
MVYRRGSQDMSAFAFEYEHAREAGVRFLWHVTPVKVMGEKKVEALELARLESAEDGSLVPTSGPHILLEVDLVVLAIGQATHAEFVSAAAGRDAGKVRLERGRIVIDRETGQTSNPKFFAGGDCTNGGREVVDAVADGKRAGIGIAVWFEGQHANA